MTGPLGRQGQAAPLGQHCPQMTQRPGSYVLELEEIVGTFGSDASEEIYKFILRAH